MKNMDWDKLEDRRLIKHVPVSSIRSAIMALDNIDNLYGDLGLGLSAASIRDVMIALANEITAMENKPGVDSWDDVIAQKWDRNND